MKPYGTALKQPSRKLRSHLTNAEQLLWQRLRRKQIYGVQFYRQKPLWNYIVDFYCAEVALVIEVDGSQHLEPENRSRDQQRDRMLAAQGFKVLRYDNRQVLTELENVVAEITRCVQERLNPP